MWFKDLPHVECVSVFLKNIRPITPDDLHPWQRKGWVKVDKIRGCRYLNGSEFDKWLERLEGLK